ncbi:hypothetical protein KFU94_21255 [Chloroflexi bacterium TSY]|nr:hypothetical protein [Chloroflexi bacterium TSY]
MKRFGQTSIQESAYSSIVSASRACHGKFIRVRREKTRARVVWRTDGGAGSENIRWLLSRNYQFMMKGNSNRRAHLWAQQVTRWDPCGDVFLAEIPSPIKFNRPVRIFLKKRVKNEQIWGWFRIRFTLLIHRQKSI